MPAFADSAINSQQEMLVPGWSQPRNLSNSRGRVVNPVVLAGPNGLLHAIWEQDNRIFHTVRQGGVWSTPSSLATGFQPAAGLARNGEVHLAFSNQFFGRYRVFHVVWNGEFWSLPRLVSKTSGNATSPALAIDRSGLVHASWADTSPGFSIIYHGWLDSTWLNEPIPNARGDIPALVQDARQDKLYLAYQAAGVSGSQRDVFFTQGYLYNWPSPENISLSSDSESTNAALAADGQGKVHVVWQEQTGASSRIRYRSGVQSAWSAVRDLSDGAQSAQQAAIAVTQASHVHVVWQQGNTLVYRRRFLGGESWEPAKVLVANEGGLGEPVITGAPNGELNLGWTGRTAISERDLFLSQREPALRPKVFIPAAG